MPADLVLPTTQTCPLCQQDNACQMSLGGRIEDCWCMTASIAPEALARVPLPQRGQVCICPHCARPLPPTS